MTSLYGPALSAIHHEAYGGHGDLCAPGILSALEPGSRVLELGAGSGALTRHLVAAGHPVVATDASTAMLDLLAAAVPEATIGRLVLGDDAIPSAPAIVSVGHVLSYLESEELVLSVLADCAAALEPGGVLLLDLLDRSYGEARAAAPPHHAEGDGWEMEVDFSLPAPDRFLRDISLTWTAADGSVVVERELHANVLVDAERARDRLSGAGLEVELRRSFGSEQLPQGFAVLSGRRPAG